MARYLARACPRCNGYVGITIREPGRNVPVEAVNGRCTQCTYRLAWIVIRGKGSGPITPGNGPFESQTLSNPASKF